jgi:hypothetical protein
LKKKLYAKYSAEQGVLIDREEYDKLFSLRFDRRQFEVMLSNKMFRVREH